MPKSEINLKNFLDQLKKIDVNELLIKAKTLKFEDIRTIKFVDLLKITKNKYFLPLIGISIASLITILFSIPSFKSLLRLQNKSKLYSIESSYLDQLSKELDKNENINQIYEASLPEVESLVAKQSSLIYLTNILDNAASRSLVDIIEFRPIEEQELATCSSLTDQELNESNSFSSSQSNTFFEDEEFNDEEFNDDFVDDDFGDSLNENSASAREADIQALLYDNAISNESISQDSSSNLSINSFKANYFELLLEADYINLINFLRSIQEYKIFITPVCFQPRVATSNQGFEESTSQSQSSGLVRARLIINLPTN